MKLPAGVGHPNPDDTFFSDLATFATGMMCHWADLTELHQNRITNRLRSSENPGWSRNVTIPDIQVQLSELLPKPGRRRQKPWAKGWVSIEFRGVQRPLGAPETSRPNVVVNANISVVDKTRFKLLGENIEKDVLFHRRKGAFSLRLRAEVGKTIIDTLSSKVQAIERLVDFFDAIQRSGPGVQCESATLRKVVFTYSDKIPSPNPPKAGSTPSPQQAGAQAPRYKATLDLSDPDKVKLILDDNSPHIRVHDLLSRLVNSEDQFESLPQWLCKTLSLHRALDQMEDKWAMAAATNRGRLTILPRSLDRLALRLQLCPAKNRSKPRLLALEVKLMMRSGQLWWHGRQGDTSAMAAYTAVATGANVAESEKVLLSVWDKAAQINPGGVKRLGDSFAAKSEGIETVFEILNRLLMMALTSGQQQARQVAAPA